MINDANLQAVRDLTEQANRLRDACSIRSVSLPPVPHDALRLFDFLAFRRAARAYETH